MKADLPFFNVFARSIQLNVTMPPRRQTPSGGRLVLTPERARELARPPNYHFRGIVSVPAFREQLLTLWKLTTAKVQPVGLSPSFDSQEIVATKAQRLCDDGCRAS